MNRCISVLGALILSSAFVCSADDELFKMCHDFDADDDIEYSIPDGFKAYKPENCAIYITRDQTDYDLSYAGWIYPVMAVSEAKDCIMLYPGSGYSGWPEFKAIC